MKKILPWQKLDNAATIFPLMSGKRDQNNFRMQVTLSSPVDKRALETAINNVLARFEQYNVTLKGGFIWYRFERATTPVTVGDANEWGMSPLPLFEKGGRTFRFNVQGCDIYADFFHAMGDGAGTGEFLKAVVFEYLKETGCPVEAEDRVITLSTPVDPGESEDAFHKYYKPLPLNELEVKSMQGSKAFHIEGTRYENHGAECVQYTLPSHEVLNLCHSIGCTVTEYLGAAFAMAVYDGMIRGKRKKNACDTAFYAYKSAPFLPFRHAEKLFSVFAREDRHVRSAHNGELHKSHTRKFEEGHGQSPAAKKDMHHRARGSAGRDADHSPRPEKVFPGLCQSVLRQGQKDSHLLQRGRAEITREYAPLRDQRALQPLAQLQLPVYGGGGFRVGQSEHHVQQSHKRGQHRARPERAVCGG